MCSWTGSGSLISAAVLIGVAAGCGGDNGSGPPLDPVVIQRAPTGSGDGQTGTVGEALAGELRVVITRASEPQTGVVVDWATVDGGSLAPSTTSTDADGVATSIWTLGPDAGPQTATAAADGADGSPVSFTATAEDDTPPPPPAAATIQVLGPDGGNRFEPTQVTIQAGETVEWVWPALAQNHNVVPDGDDPAPSGAPADGPTEYSFTFTTAGTYDFYCGVHGGPAGFGMSGTVIVEP